MGNKDFYVNKCSCGRAIGKDSSKCQKCAKEHLKKNLPSDAVIMKMLKTKSVKKVAKELGVGESTIYKIRLKYQ